LAYGAWLAETPDAWPTEALESAHRQFIDVLGVTIAGAVEPATLAVLDTVRNWGTGPSTAILQSARLAPPWAALVNGTAAHALDFDDNFDPAKAHATAVLAPAILALAEQEDASGRACLDAYIAGLQILGRVGQGVNPAHRNRGWHATATVGAIGTAAACASSWRARISAMPSMPGMRKSTKARSMPPARSRASPACPSAAAITSWPNERSVACSVLRKAVSSSTIRMRAMAVPE
jgi:hypothetical protein